MSDANGTADLVFVNGPVYTVDAARSWARAVAVKAGTIVGRRDRRRRPRVDRARTPRSSTWRGRMLLPGFQDAHVHPPASGFEMLRCDLNELYSLEEYRARSSRTTPRPTPTPRGSWAAAGTWTSSPAGRRPRRCSTRSSPTGRRILTNRDGHGAWVNSRALELAGITRRHAGSRRRPHRANRRRRAVRHPARGSDATSSAPSRPPDTDEDYAAGLRVAQTYLHSLGITAWQDAIVGIDDSYRTLDAYVAGGRTRASSPRASSGALWWDRHRGLEQIERSRRRASASGGRAVRADQREDHAGRRHRELHGRHARRRTSMRTAQPTENLGISFVDPELLKEAVTQLDALGFQAHFHALGDRAVRESLDAIEAALIANGPSDNRHHLAHIQIVHPDDIPRFRQLGAVANGQPLWAAHEGQMDNLTIPFIGPERASWQYPFASLVRAGAVLAFGSDWSVSSPDPLREMHVAVERRAPAEGLEDLGEAIGRGLHPRGADRPGHRDRGVHDGLRLREPPGRADRLDRGRQVRGPHRDRSEPLRDPGDRDLEGRGSSSRSSRASASSTSRTPSTG